MTSEMLNKILEVEKSVAAAELDAKTNADTIINEAKLKAGTIVAKAQQNTRENTAAKMSLAKQKAAGIKKVATDEAKVEGLQIIEAAKKKQPDAIKVLKDYLVPNSGN
jgi:vacuolar-type H+-ATPase subunit H